MADLYEEIVKLKAEGGSAAVATIIGAEGSTPRETGAKMGPSSGPLEAAAWRDRSLRMPSKSFGKKNRAYSTMTSRERKRPAPG